MCTFCSICDKLAYRFHWSVIDVLVDLMLAALVSTEWKDRERARFQWKLRSRKPQRNQDKHTWNISKMFLFLCSFCVAYLFGSTPAAYFGISHCPACGYKNSHNYSSFRGRDKSTKHLSYFLKYCALACRCRHMGMPWKFLARFQVFARPPTDFEAA